jgi:putative spermidine/putrescine transport system permease protein
MKRFLTVLMVTQFFTFTIIRTYAAMLILGNHGIINVLLMKAKLIDAPLKLMYNELGVGIGLILGSMPFMVFCVSSVLENIHKDWEDAARSLGADRMRVFWRITLPLSLPGIMAGLVIVFLWNLISYITPALLGGGFFDMIANFVFNQALSLFDYPFAATGAMVMLVITFVVVFVLSSSLERLIRGVKVTK